MVAKTTTKPARSSLALTRRGCQAVLELLPHENVLLVHPMDLPALRLYYEGCHFTDIAIDGPCSEEHTAALLHQALKGIKHLHSIGISHGNIRSSNMVIEAATGLVKLVTEISDDDSSSDEGGSDSSEVEHFDADTPSSRRPAASLSWPCDSGGRASDIWSVGCVALHLLTGCSHLNVVSHTRLTANPAALRTASPKAWFPQGPRPVLPIGLSMEASAFLSECLGEETPTVGELLEHPFLELAKRCHPATSDGDKDVLLKLIGMLDDVLLVGEEEHRHARVAPRRPTGVPALASLLPSPPLHIVAATAAGPPPPPPPGIRHLLPSSLPPRPPSLVPTAAAGTSPAVGLAKRRRSEGRMGGELAAMLPPLPKRMAARTVRSWSAVTGPAARRRRTRVLAFAKF